MQEGNDAETGERVAALLGIAQNTISDWFKQDTVKQNRPTTEVEGMHNVDSDNMHTTPPPDARVKIPPAQWPIILERAEAGETQEQIAPSKEAGVAAPAEAQNEEPTGSAAAACGIKTG